MSNRPEDLILAQYDTLLARFGDTAQGAHWPNEADRKTRFDVMLGVMQAPNDAAVVCDLGCGTGELYGHIRARGLQRIDYIGADRSALALSFARSKYPQARFVEIDVNEPAAPVNELACDYVVCNGVFTVKWQLSDAQMWEFLENTLWRLWPVVRRGLAFNVISKAVDWERDDLFHASMDDMARLLHRIAGRRVVFRADYGLYEYTAYAYR